VTTYPFGLTDTFTGWRSLGFENFCNPTSRGDVVIGNDVWIGSGVTLMSGVSLGDGAVIAANSHVVRNVSPYSIHGGNPARHIRYRFDPEIIEKLLALCWWDWPDTSIQSAQSLLVSEPTHENLKKLFELKSNIEI